MSIGKRVCVCVIKATKQLLTGGHVLAQRRRQIAERRDAAAFGRQIDGRQRRRRVRVGSFVDGRSAAARAQRTAAAAAKGRRADWCGSGDALDGELVRRVDGNGSWIHKRERYIYVS